MEFPLKEGEVRINKESFTSRVFRTYIDAEYNVLDYGSSLSLERPDISSAGEIVPETMKENQYWTISADGTKVRYRSEGEWERRKNAKH